MRTTHPSIISLEDRLRFESKFVKSDGDDCWEWIPYRNKKGYGQFGIEGKLWRAHRVSWLVYRGKITSPCVLHKCDNPPCVNPAHLFLGTIADNSRDMMRKGRCNSGKSTQPGEQNSNARLTWDEVDEIRLLYQMGDSQEELAKEFGVSEACISNILNHKTWVPTGRHISFKRPRLTWDDVGVIRLLARMGDSGEELARLFGVSRSTIYRILLHESWKLK